MRSSVKTYRYRLGKNQIIVIQIHQQAAARAEIGNALASNAANVQIVKKQHRRSEKRRHARRRLARAAR